MQETERFNQAAATWDLLDCRVVLAGAIAEAIRHQVPLSPTWKALDFGCGTGLVTLDLGPSMATITGADSSTGMLETLAGKALASGIPLRLLPLDEGGGGDLGGPYDLIFSSMTLHHVEDVGGLFRRFASHLAPGGHVALADLDEEDGSFHEGNMNVSHLGFRRNQVRRWLEAAGFAKISVETATTTAKDKRVYPIFLATAMKP